MLSFCKYSVSACKQNFLPKRKTSCRVKNIIWKYYKPICSTIPQSFLHRSGWKPAVHPVLVSALSGIRPQRVQMQNATTGISVQTFKPVCQLYWNTTWKKPHESSSAAKPNMQKQLLGFFTIPSYFSSSVYPLPHSFLLIPTYSWFAIPDASLSLPLAGRQGVQSQPAFQVPPRVQPYYPHMLLR